MAAVLSYQANDLDGNTVANGASYTFPLTVASAAGQRRAVMLSAVADLTITGFSAVTIDGQSAALRGSVNGGDDDFGAHAFLRCYVADGTSGTSINVVATLAGSGHAYAAYCALWTLSDSDGAAFDTASGTSITPTLDLDTPADAAVLAAFYGYDGSGGTAASLAWAGVTENFDGVTFFGDEVFSAGDASSVAAATPRSVSAVATGLVDARPALGFSVSSLSVSFSPTVAATKGKPFRRRSTRSFNRTFSFITMPKRLIVPKHKLIIPPPITPRSPPQWLQR